MWLLVKPKYKTHIALYVLRSQNIRYVRQKNMCWEHTNMFGAHNFLALCRTKEVSFKYLRAHFCPVLLTQDKLSYVIKRTSSVYVALYVKIMNREKYNIWVSFTICTTILHVWSTIVSLTTLTTPTHTRIIRISWEFNSMKCLPSVLNRTAELWWHMYRQRKLTEKWRMSIGYWKIIAEGTIALTVAKNSRFTSKNPFALMAIWNFSICSTNSSFALCSSSLSPHQNTNSSTFLTSSICWIGFKYVMCY